MMIPMLILLACWCSGLSSRGHAQTLRLHSPLLGTCFRTRAQQWWQWRTEAVQQLLHVLSVHAGGMEPAQLLCHDGLVLGGPGSPPRFRPRQQLGQRPAIARRRSGRFGAAASAQAVSTTSGPGWEQRRSLAAPDCHHCCGPRLPRPAGIETAEPSIACRVQLSLTGCQEGAWLQIPGCRMLSPQTPCRDVAHNSATGAMVDVGARSGGFLAPTA